MHVAVPALNDAAYPHGPGTAARVSGVRRQAHRKLVWREEMTLHEATEALLKTLDAAMVDNDFGHIVIPRDDVADVLAAMESATAALEGEA
jgi:hypothetical protein